MNDLPDQRDEQHRGEEQRGEPDDEADEAHRVGLPLVGHGLSPEEVTRHILLGFSSLEHSSSAYNDILAFDPDHTDALRGLARIYEQTEQWDRAVEIMERLVDVVEAKEKVDLSYRLGKIFDEQMQMVGHEAVRKYCDPVSRRCVPKLLQQCVHHPLRGKGGTSMRGAERQEIAVRANVGERTEAERPRDSHARVIAVPAPCRARQG